MPFISSAHSHSHTFTVSIPMSITATISSYSLYERPTVNVVCSRTCTQARFLKSRLQWASWDYWLPKGSVLTRILNPRLREVLVYKFANDIYTHLAIMLYIWGINISQFIQGVGSRGKNLS